MSGTIDVSNNEFGGIEVCREAQLDLTQAALVNESETKERPTLWSDSGKGTIQANESQPLYIWTEYASGKDHIYLAQVDGASYETLAQALEAAGLSEGDKTVTLLKDVAVDSGEQAESRASGTVLTLPAGVTLNGQGHTVSYAGEAEIDSLLAVDGADSAIRNACFADGGKAQHVLTFSGAENARLEGVTVQGGQTAAILVNGASVTLENSALKPQEGAGASITYQADSKLPSLTLNNVEASPETNLLYISPETLEQIGTLGSTEDMEEIMEQVRASISGSDRVDLTYDEDSGSASAPAPVRHAVTLEAGKNGSLSADRTQVQSGEVVTLTVTPEKGYRLEKLEARDGQDQVVKLTREEDGTYTFTMPENPVTVSAVFGTIFQDVAESDWFYAAVQYVYEQGIMSGVEEGRFEPGTTLTRAMLAQTLYAMEGKPQVSGGEDFSDGDRFAPNDALTREQMALILYRYAQHKSYDVQVDGEPLEGFQDVEKISDWAVEAMEWAVSAKLLSGTGDNLLTPAGTATRAQVAQVLANFCQTVA